MSAQIIASFVGVGIIAAWAVFLIHQDNKKAKEAQKEHQNKHEDLRVLSSMYDIETVRKDFPILGREVYKRPLVYLDNAATTQKPRSWLSDCQ